MFWYIIRSKVRLPLGRQGKVLNCIYSGFEGISNRVEQFQKMDWYKLILPVQFSLGQFYVAKIWSYGKIVPGANCGKKQQPFAKWKHQSKENFYFIHNCGTTWFIYIHMPDWNFHIQCDGVWLENDLLVFAIGSYGGPPDAGGLPQKVVHLGCFKNI